MDRASAIPAALRVADIAAILLAAVAVQAWHEGTPWLPINGMGAVAACTLLTLQIFQVGRIYMLVPWQAMGEYLMRMTGLWLLVGGGLVAIGAFTATLGQFPPSRAATWLGTSYLAILASRLAAARLVRFLDEIAGPLPAASAAHVPQYERKRQPETLDV